MYNSLQTNIFLCLTVFAAVWFLFVYIDNQIRRNDDTGVISKAESQYIAKFRRTIRALLISFITFDAELSTRTVYLPCSNYSRYSHIIWKDKNKEPTPIDRSIVNYLITAKYIKFHSETIEIFHTIHQTFRPTVKGIIFSIFTLLHNRSIMKTIDISNGITYDITKTIKNESK